MRSSAIGGCFGILAEMLETVNSRRNEDTRAIIHLILKDETWVFTRSDGDHIDPSDLTKSLGR